MAMAHRCWFLSKLLGSFWATGYTRQGTTIPLVSFAAETSLKGCAHELIDRVRDWLYGITQVRPVGDSQTIIEGETEAEDLRSINHLVSWQKENGGAGITVNFGKWKNVKASFPLHNQAANRELLHRWSRTTIFTNRDLDAIRALFGEKVLLLLHGKM